MKQNSTSLTRKRPVYNLVLAAMFLALGIILPFFTGQIPQIGNMLPVSYTHLTLPTICSV